MFRSEMANFVYVFGLIIMFFDLLVGIVQCRPIIINYGIDDKNFSDKCVHAYGFIPCAESVWGYIYQIVVIQYLTIRGEKLLTQASTKIFASLGTGIYGAIIFRLLMALPLLVIMMVSGILSSKEAAQSQVSFGISVSAGSTIFTLTVLWGIHVFLLSTMNPQKNIEEDLSTSQQLLTGDEEHSEESVLTGKSGKEKPSNLFSGFSDTGVMIDKHTSEAADFMFLSSIPFAILQLTNLFSYREGRLAVIVVSLLSSLVLLFFYFRYQIRNESAQKKGLAYAKFEIDNSVKEALKDFDQDLDDRISEVELYVGLQKIQRLMSRGRSMKSRENDRDVEQRTIDESNKNIKFSKRALLTNVMQAIIGFTILFVLARPLTVSTQQLSMAMGIPSLAISFVVIPAVINTRRALAALFPPNKETHEVASITFTELYNGVVMSNMMGLLASLVISFAKDLTWDYSAEVLIIFAVCAIMGLLSWFRVITTYPKWTCFLALILYPCTAGLFIFTSTNALIVL